MRKHELSDNIPVEGVSLKLFSDRWKTSYASK